jgi:Flp pilus assembly protein TadG
MKTSKNTSGQSLVEFALLLPVLLVIVMALFEIGRAVFYYAVLNNAAREGTRVAIVQPDCDLRFENNCANIYEDTQTITCTSAASTANQVTCAEIQDKLFNLPELLDSTRTTITIYHAQNAYNEPTVQVEIVYLFQPLLPGLNLINNISMRVESVMLKTPIAKPIS